MCFLKSLGAFESKLVWSESIKSIQKHPKSFRANADAPRRQLGLILSSDTAATQATPFKNLDRLYMNVLLATIAEEDEVDLICGRFRRVMGAILSVLEPASVALLINLLSMDKEEVEYALRPLSAVLDIPDHHHPDHAVRIFHPSFPDFMTHPKRCGDHRFFIDTRESHVFLAQVCLSTFTEFLSTTQGGSRNKSTSSSKLDYVLLYWLSHLVSSLSPSPKFEVPEHLHASPDAFCVSAIMRFLASGHKGPTSYVISGEMSLILRDVAQHSHVVVLYMEGAHHAAAIVPYSNGQPVHNIHVLRIGAELQGDGVPFHSDKNPWHTVVEPILSVLKLEPQAGRQRPRIHWCCLGQAHSLWLHAAGLFKDASLHGLSISSYAVSSYVPNLAALLALHGATQAWAVSDLWTCLAYNSHLRDIGIDRKPTGVEEEAVLVASILSQPERIVKTTQSAHEALDMLASSHIFHYAGYEQREGPDTKLTDRGFMLDSQLTICDIIHTPLHCPVLAYLSCHPQLSSTPLGSAPGMLLSGFKSIVTATECVTERAALAMYAYHQLHSFLMDEDGPVLAEAFYRSWLANGRDGLVSLQDIPYALDDACAVLRAAGKDPLRCGALFHVGA